MSKKIHKVKVHTGLPPMVPGTVRGYLSITFHSLLWDCATPPPAPRLCVLMKWWGEKTNGSVFRVPIQYKGKLHPSLLPSSACYPIHSGWKQFRVYLEDMGHLSLKVGLGRSSEDMFVIGECLVPNLSTLNPHKPVARTCSVVTKDGEVHLGRLKMEFTIKMNPRNISTRKSGIIKQNHGGSSLPELTSKCKRGNVPLSLTEVSVHNSTSPLKKEPKPPPSKVSIPVVTVKRDNVIPSKNGRKWRPISQFGFVSPGPVINRKSTDQSDDILLGNNGKQIIDDLLEHAKDLHQNMIHAINDVGVVEGVVNNEEITKPMKDTMEYDEQELVDMTPPISPSESMLYVESVDEEGFQLSEHTCTDIRKMEKTEIIHKSIIPDSTPFSPMKNRNGTKHFHISQCTCKQCHASDIQTAPLETSQQDPQIFHVLLEIPKGSDIFRSTDPVHPPNVFIVCRMFCTKTPLRNGIHWRTREPVFDFKQIFPICMRLDVLLEQLTGGYAIIEVWHSERTQEDDDKQRGEEELLGLVKISLLPFHTAVWSVLQDRSLINSMFPVVAVDSHCPIVDPFSGITHGHIKVKLVMGTPKHLPADITRIISDSCKVLPSLPVCSSNSKHVKTSTIRPINTISLKEEEEEEDSEEDEENKIEEEEEEDSEEDEENKIEEEEEETEDKTVEDEDERVVKDNREIGEIGRDSHLPLMDFTVQYDAPMKDTFQLEVLISQALHLPRLSTPQGMDHTPPRAYVTCHPHPSVDKITTHTCLETTRPHWEYHCLTNIPGSFMDSGLCELEFQVWSLSPEDTLQDQISVDPHTHIFLGRAFVDLVPLRCGLRSVCGWYNITDLAGDIRGQLKIAVTPKDIIPTRRETMKNTYTRYNTHSLSLINHTPSRPSSIHSYDMIIEQPQLYKEHTDVSQETLSFLRRELKSHVTELEEIQKSLETRLQQDTQESITNPNLPKTIPSPNATITTISSRNHGDTDTSNSSHVTDSRRHDRSVSSLSFSADNPLSALSGSDGSNFSTEMITPLRYVSSSPIDDNVVLLSPIQRCNTPKQPPSVNKDVLTCHQIQQERNFSCVETFDVNISGSLLMPSETDPFHATKNVHENMEATKKQTKRRVDEEEENKDEEDKEEEEGEDEEEEEDEERLVNATGKKKAMLSRDNDRIVFAGLQGQYLSEEIKKSEPTILESTENNEVVVSPTCKVMEEHNKDVLLSPPLTSEQVHLSNEVTLIKETESKKQIENEGMVEEEKNESEDKQSTEDEVEDSEDDEHNLSSDTESLTSQEGRNHRKESFDDNEEEDTSIMEESEEIVSEPKLSSSFDDDEEEEEEVKRLFDRLLKQRNISEEENTCTSDSSSDNETESEKEVIQSTDDIKCTEDTIQNTSIESYKTSKRSIPWIWNEQGNNQLPSYFLPEEQLAERLLAIRQSALSRLPPRYLPDESEEEGVSHEVSSVEKPTNGRGNVSKRKYPRIKTPERERLQRILCS